jgi:hypothetical protein
MLMLIRLLIFCAATSAFCPIAGAQPAPETPKPDARYQNWIYQTPDPLKWMRSEKDGNLMFSVDEPSGDFCTLTLFADAKANPDFPGQFEQAVAADQRAKDTLKIEADTGASPSKSTEGDDVLIRNMRSETHTLHTFHMYVGTRSGDHFDLAAFQTTSETSWNQYGTQAAQFLRSLTTASSLRPEEVEKLLGKAEAAPPPMLPGFAGAPAAAAAAQPLPAAPAAKDIPDIPLNRSPLVVNGAVIQKNGKPIDGVKLSQHDTAIFSPSIAVAANGVIHVAFVEQHRTTYALAVYHRSSSDGGKTWTEAENLSEDQPNLNVGLCYALIDGKDRLYVVWRSGLVQYDPASAYASSGQPCNLMYRVLENGKWSKIIPAHPPAPHDNPNEGSLSYFATIDAAGRAQVVWNANPDKWHPELTAASGTYHQHLAGIGNGLVFQATLNGTTPSAPHEVFLTPVAGQGEQGGYGAYCDGLDSLKGYVDAAGAPHFVAAVTRTHDSSLSGQSWYELIENGAAARPFALPDLSFHAKLDVPTLLVDANGKQHLVELYLAGERPKIRDHVVGSDDDPATIGTAPVKGTIVGFQAYQGPGGRMIAIMQLSETAYVDHGDTYVSISRGRDWSAPVNVTNNAGRTTFASKQSGAAGVVVTKGYGAGMAAAAFDRNGHLLLLMINNETGLFGVSSFGAVVAGGSTSTPMLQFLRF